MISCCVIINHYKVQMASLWRNLIFWSEVTNRLKIFYVKTCIGRFIDIVSSGPEDAPTLLKPQANLGNNFIHHYQGER